MSEIKKMRTNAAIDIYVSQILQPYFIGLRLNRKGRQTGMTNMEVLLRTNRKQFIFALFANKYGPISCKGIKRVGRRKLGISLRKYLFQFIYENTHCHLYTF